MGQKNQCFIGFQEAILARVFKQGVFSGFDDPSTTLLCQSRWVKLGHFRTFHGSGRVRKRVKSSFGESGSQDRNQRIIARHSPRKSAEEVD